MKGNDMLAFEAWLNDNWDPKTDPVVRCAQSAWEAACEFKQKEIDELEKEKDYLCQKMENMREIYKNSEKLLAENSKLIECIVFYANENNWGEINHSDLGKVVFMRLSDDTELLEDDYFIGGKRARQVLKELEEK